MNITRFILDYLQKKKVIRPLDGTSLVGKIAQKYTAWLSIYSESLVWDNGISPTPYPTLFYPTQAFINADKSNLFQEAALFGLVATEEFFDLWRPPSLKLWERQYLAIFRWPNTEDIWYLRKALKRRVGAVLKEAAEKGIEPTEILLMPEYRTQTPEGNILRFLPIHFFILGLEAKKKGYALLLSHFPAGHFFLVKAKRPGFWEEAKGIKPQGRIGFFAFPLATAKTVEMAKRREFFPCSLMYFTMAGEFDAMGFTSNGQFKGLPERDFYLSVIERIIYQKV